MSSLTEKIKVFALGQAGFDAVGISSVRLSGHFEEASKVWLAKGSAGTMTYLQKNNRWHPENLLPNAASVISLAVNYYHPEDSKPVGEGWAKIAKYAYGEDYHQVLQKKLDRLLGFIETVAPGTRSKGFVDAGPIAEKPFAQTAGIGFYGKNTTIITSRFGSWIFLADIVTTAQLDCDQPAVGDCGSCTLCIEACPTGALGGDYQMDARKCVSYRTVEAYDPMRLESHEGWFFGCDICQDVCPFNQSPVPTRNPEFFPTKIAGTWVNLKQLESVDPDLFSKSALSRRYRKRLRSAQA